MQHHDLSPDPWAQAHAGGDAVTPRPAAPLPAPAAISPELRHLFVTAEDLAAAHCSANEAVDGPSRAADPAQRAALQEEEERLRLAVEASEQALMAFPARSVADAAAKLRRYGGILGYCQSAVPGTRTTHSLLDACLREPDCDTESDEARWVIAVLRDLDRIAAAAMPEAKSSAASLMRPESAEMQHDPSPDQAGPEGHLASGAGDAVVALARERARIAAEAEGQDDETFDRMFDDVFALDDQIVATPAASIAGITEKLRICAWMEDFDAGGTTGLMVLSAIADLERFARDRS